FKFFPLNFSIHFPAFVIAKKLSTSNLFLRCCYWDRGTGIEVSPIFAIKRLMISFAESICFSEPFNVGFVITSLVVSCLFSCSVSLLSAGDVFSAVSLALKAFSNAFTACC
ncbi:hypothetical protein P2G69_14485, partial [Mannheimia haemolytica]|nr:hypothetical protein [Mannheimia haemolytica]